MNKPLGKSPTVGARHVWHRTPWRWLFSLRVGIVLLAVTATASMAGTAIAPLERACALVYSSWWYRTLLLLLAVNVGCATVRAVVERVVPFGRVRFEQSPAFYDSIVPSRSIPFPGTAEAAAMAFRRRGFKTATAGPFGYAWKGKLSRWGAPISHTGVVIVLLSGFVSAWVSVEGRVRLAEGEETDTMIARTDPPWRVPLGFALRCEDFDTGFFPKTGIPSRFISTVAVLESGKPSQTAAVEVNRSWKTHGWTLHQTHCEELPDCVRYVLSVGRPSLGVPAAVELSPEQRRPVPAAEGAEIALGEGPNPLWTVFQDGAAVQQGRLAGRGSPLRLRVERFEPDFVMGPGRQIASRSQALNNPAVQIALYEGESEVFSQWLFDREDLKALMQGGDRDFDLELVGISGEAPQYRFQIIARRRDDRLSSGTLSLALGEEAFVGPQDETPTPEEPSEGQGGPWDVRLLGTAPAYATVLTLTRNPAVAGVYFGCAVMMAGLLAAFFIRRKEIWFWVDGHNTRLRVAGVYRHPQTDLDRATRAALKDLLEEPGE